MYATTQETKSPMFTPEPPLKFPPAEQAIADRLMKIAPEIDRIEGYSQPHAMAVARLAAILAAPLELRGHDLTALLLAALGHDLGERALKRNYLLRADALTWEETLDLWRHPILGEQQAAELRLPREAQLLIRWHHEWWNGEGYPDALAGEAIPLGARILRVADTWCALTADRPYRAALDPLEAEEVMTDQAGIEFDPLVVQTLLDHLQAVREEEESDPLNLLLDQALTIEMEEETGEPVDMVVEETEPEPVPGIIPVVVPVLPFIPASPEVSETVEAASIPIGDEPDMHTVAGAGDTAAATETPTEMVETAALAPSGAETERTGKGD